MDGVSNEASATTGVLRWTQPDLLDEAMYGGLVGPGAPFELVVEDVLGAPVQVFAIRSRSVGELITAAADHGDRAYLVGPDADITFAGLPSAVGIAAARLAAVGVSPGDRVVLTGPTSLELCRTALGVAALGAVLVVANPSWTVAELAHVLTATEPSVVLGEQDPLAKAIEAGAPTTVTFTDLYAGPDPDPLPFAEVDEDDPFAIVFTSGTTGRPKGAILTHRNAVHFCLSNAATAFVNRMVSGVESPSSGHPTTVIAASPMFHISGLLGQLVNTLAWGISVIIAPPGRWDETTHLELTQRHHVTSWSLVPTQLWRLIEHPELDRFDLSSLESVGGGGATFEPELLRVVAERIPHVGTGMRVGYGMTECSGTFTMLQPPFDAASLATVGGAVAGAEVTIRDVDGTILPDGEIGEIWGRSAGIFAGYWRDPDATAAVLDDERWYRTGDYGRIVDNRLHLESRLRDMIIRGGENVYPIEIESRLVEHPDIVEAAVVGAPHRTLGQEVKAVIVVRPGASVTAEDVATFCAETLVRYKVPTVIEIVDVLPRNDVGKVLKEQLR